jgi:DNA-binding CsgD family transcriptional regulator
MDTLLFSEREKDVVRLLLQGKSNKQIALDLGISNRTVEYHLSNIYSKLGVSSRSEAILKLTEGRLRESAGQLPVESTVDFSATPADNAPKSISRRIPLKRSQFMLGGLSALALVATILIVTKFVHSQAVPEATPVPTVTSIDVTATPVLDAPISTEALPASPVDDLPTPIAFPPHTVNGYTAQIESYYVDISYITFQVRITKGDKPLGMDAFIGSPDLYDEFGRMINTSGGYGPAIDPALYQFTLVPVTLLTGDRIKGQFEFELENPENMNEVWARFNFDFDLPLYPETRFYPKQSISANGLEILVDSVTITPAFTQVYICFEPPSTDPWTVGNQTMIQIAGREELLYNSSELFSSATGSYWGIRSEPYWVPPVKVGSCHKLGFRTGSLHPTTLTLTIPDLENLIPYLTQTGIVEQFGTMYPGLSERQSYHKYLEEHGYTYKGPWTFTIDLQP